MDFSDLILELTPLLMEFLVGIVTILLTWLSFKANAWLKANISSTNLGIINTLSRDIVLFVEQVAEMRGITSSSEKKEIAVNRLMENLADLGIAITMAEADKSIEAAVNAFTYDALEDFADYEIGYGDVE